MSEISPIKNFRDLAIAEMDSVYRMAFHLTRNPEEASDMVQETYLRALKAESKFELREAGIRPWLFKILHNCFYTRMGKKKREPMLVEEFHSESTGLAPDEPSPAWDLASMDWEHVDERLKDAIDQLADPYRNVLLLWAIEGLKYREIAEIVDVPLGTVMSRLYRAREILSGKLSELAAEVGIKTNESKA